MRDQRGGEAVAARGRMPLWATALFAIALAIFGTIQAIYVFEGENTYGSLVLPGEPAMLQVRLASGGTWSFTREILLVLHRQTLAYVLGESSLLPQDPQGAPFYDEAESAHLADVRGVFAGARIAYLVSALLIASLLLRARRRGAVARLVRDGALAAAGLVLLIAFVFAVAFEPAFLAFHYVFFPEGDFLFDPATSHLLLVYPERYWYGVTLRVGVSVVAASAIVGGAAALRLRRSSAIVRAE